MDHDYLQRSYNQAILPAKLALTLGEYVSVRLTDIQIRDERRLPLRTDSR